MIKNILLFIACFLSYNTLCSDQTDLQAPGPYTIMEISDPVENGHIFEEAHYFIKLDCGIVAIDWFTYESLNLSPAIGDVIDIAIANADDLPECPSSFASYYSFWKMTFNCSENSTIDLYFAHDCDVENPDSPYASIFFCLDNLEKNALTGTSSVQAIYDWRDPDEWHYYEYQIKTEKAYWNFSEEILDQFNISFTVGDQIEIISFSDYIYNQGNIDFTEDILYKINTIFRDYVVMITPNATKDLFFKKNYYDNFLYEFILADYVEIEHYLLWIEGIEQMPVLGSYTILDITNEIDDIQGSYWHEDTLFIDLYFIELDFGYFCVDWFTFESLNLSPGDTINIGLSTTLDEFPLAYYLTFTTTHDEVPFLPLGLPPELTKLDKELFLQIGSLLKTDIYLGSSTVQAILDEYYLNGHGSFSYAIRTEQAYWAFSDDIIKQYDVSFSVGDTFEIVSINDYIHDNYDISYLSDYHLNDVFDLLGNTVVMVITGEDGSTKEIFFKRHMPHYMDLYYRPTFIPEYDQDLVYRLLYG